MTVILGPSGCGKTTLLKILSGRFTNKYSGHVLYDNVKVEKKILRKTSAYVHQDDDFMQTQTVRETIKFVTDLRNIKFEEKLVNCLGLDNILDSKIGDSNKGISAGERKRLSILLELLDDVDIVYLDEPTSGLDALNAVKLIETIKNLNLTVCCVLHQPSANIFFMFDEVIVMNGGSIVFQGKPEGIFEWFSFLNLKCPEHYNPADFIFTDVLPNLNENSEIYEVENDFESKEVNKIYKKKKKISFFKEFKILSKRQVQIILRDRMMSVARLFQTLFTALIISLVFYNTYIKEDLIRIKNIQGVFYFFNLNCLFAAAFASLPAFFQSERIIEKEFQAGYYRFSSYFLSKTLFDTFLNITHPVLLVSIVLLIMKFDRGFLSFLSIVSVCVLTTLHGHSFSILASAICSSISVASAAVPSFFLPLTIINGMLVDPESMFVVLRFLQYVSPTRLAFNILMKNEFEGTKMDPLTEKLVTGFIGVGYSLVLLVILYLLNILFGFFLLRRKIFKKIY
ncbi:hypothetical protein GVAV_003562 [Gurleya vavrai]